MSKPRSASVRSISASEIARNLKFFETWSTYQACEQVAYTDLPIELKADVAAVFDVDGRLPLSWIDESSTVFTLLAALAPDQVSFLQRAHCAEPSLFSDRVSTEQCTHLFSELHCVFLAWRQLRWMRKAKEKWSEADFAANVYNVFRSPAIRESAYRTQCTISLPQHHVTSHSRSTVQTKRILRPRLLVPDCAVFIRAASIRRLSLSKNSPWKVLNAHPSIKKRCRPAADPASFRYQTSPCADPPDVPGFEFASSFWEDKKPNHDLLEQAYRQNRMATTAAARHLHALHVRAPVFGLVWSNGTVRAHVDWCVRDAEHPVVLSAPYPGPDARDHNAPVFHEWNLDRPCDILKVFLLLRNIDAWTAGRFRERVESGIADLVKAVVEDNETYSPWKRRDDILIDTMLTELHVETENLPPIVTPCPSPPPGSKKAAGRKKETYSQRRQ